MSDKDPSDDWKLDNPGTGQESSRLRAALANARTAFAGPGGKVLAIVPAVAALLIGLIVGQSTGSTTIVSDSSDNGVSQQRPAATVTVTAPTTGSSDGTGSGSTGGATSAAAGQVGSGTVYLANMTAASGAFQSNDATPVLNGKPQVLAISQDLGSCSWGRSGDAGYNLGRDYTRFTGLLGLDDNSPDSKLDPTIEIEGDGLKLKTYTLTLGHPYRIDLNVSGVLRLDLVWSYSAPPVAALRWARSCWATAS
jgi:hypothetical protein